MKTTTKLITIIGIAFFLTACAMSSSSPDGVNCDYSKYEFISDMPLVCQPNGG